jgi:hypothetical protein
MRSIVSAAAKAERNNLSRAGAGALVKLTALALCGCASQTALTQKPEPQGERPYAAAVDQTMGGVCEGLQKEHIEREKEKADKNAAARRLDGSYVDLAAYALEMWSGPGMYSLGPSADPATPSLPNIYVSKIKYSAAKGVCRLSYFVVDKDTVFDKNETPQRGKKEPKYKITVKPASGSITAPNVEGPPSPPTPSVPHRPVVWHEVGLCFNQSGRLPSREP